ncbi:MAG: Na(+)/H(+) antiporter subunit B [Natronospirillum sp.]|uniref:Na(+)/H(+) antiporter subunit B n=1 Tax=Natronospirillum sp. TaxID=2812955 RepID=UPI0025D66169|nr:Na(+)/H(+) antiporter subunit B [Natronospirillum sp.]MCH8551539.1 Na(+)/H(+) antiporter subunit B [Natronospirillum sp.]
MSLHEWMLDGTLGLLVLILAVAVLHVRSLYISIVLFIAFGLLLALIWARLGAPDLALAEAAIGAGLTGTLLLAAYGRVSERRRKAEEPLDWHAGPALLLSLIIAVILMRAVWPLPDLDSALVPAVADQMAQSGVGHPVTAVLLSFRAWDTLLELLVLLLAFMAVRQLLPSLPRQPEAWPLLQAWSRLLAPLSVLIGGYLLWRGSADPGGAFQAGALLAAGAILLRLTGLLPALGWHHFWIRALILGGCMVFLAIGVAGYWLGTGFLGYADGWAGPLILLIEVFATLSIATTLTLLVIGETREVRE